MDRLDRTLTHFVDEGRISSEIADDVSREFHEHHVDVRQRLAEFAGYLGAGLATLGLILIGSQFWSDFGQVLRAAIPALAAVALLVGTRYVVHSVDHISEHPVRDRVAQVMGVVAAVLALLATAVAFDRPQGDYGEPFRWQMFIAVVVGLAVALLVAHWVPGIISTAAVGVLLFITGVSFLGSLDLLEDAGGWIGLWLVGLGVAAALVLHRFLPPAWLTRAAGVGAWVMGALMLLTVGQDPAVGQGYWVWLGRAAALVLVAVGTWLFVHGGDWPWAAGAAIAMALLVGLWTAETVNAGIALIIAGVALIGVGLALAAWRREAHPPAVP